MMIPNNVYRIGDSLFDSYITQETYVTICNKLEDFQCQLKQILFQRKSYSGVSFFEYFPYGFVLYFYSNNGKRYTNDVMLAPTFANANHVLLRADKMWERIEHG